MEIKKILNASYKKRKENSHKYDFGHLLIIGGSKMYTGSPALAGLAAYKTGVDIVTIAAPERSANIIATFSPNLITYPLVGAYINQRNSKELVELIKKKTAILIGGGLERREETKKTILQILKKIKIPCVIDADSIHHIKKNQEVIKGRNFLLTPHEKEFFALTGISIKNKELKSRIKIVENVAKKLKTTIVLKGPKDIISNGKKTFINKTGNPYMTKGGTGDTLAGIAASLLAQGNDPLTSGILAAYINGKAGDITAKDKRQALTATDIIENIHKVF